MIAIFGFLLITIGCYTAIVAIVSVLNGEFNRITIIQICLSLFFLTLGARLAKSKPTFIDKNYFPRFSNSDFPEDGVNPLSKEEFEYVSFEIWSVLSLPLSKYAVKLNQISGSTTYGYVYGFIDGYLQQHVPCEQQQQFDILNYVMQKYFDYLYEHHRDMIPDASEMETAFANPNDEFIIGMFAGGRDGIRWAQDQYYSPKGLLDAKMAMEPDINIESISFAAGKSLRGVINIAKKGTTKTKKKINSKTKLCPFCAERVNIQAKKCKHCHEFF